MIIFVGNNYDLLAICKTMKKKKRNRLTIKSAILRASKNDNYTFNNYHNLTKFRLISTQSIIYI